MPVTRVGLRTRLRDEGGFTMIIALGIMLVVMLLSVGVFSAVQGDAFLSKSNLDGKRAYSAAQAGLQAYLGQLNANAASASFWQTCANDTASNVAVQGTSGETYSYQPVVSGCATSGAVGTIVDPTVGLLRMEFTGKDGSDGATRTLVADFRPNTPLAFLWYSVHETLNPNQNSSCPGSTTNPGTNFYSNSTIPAGCQISWVTGNAVNGPMYTQDQFLVTGSPTFGRAGSTDPIESPAPTVCVGGSCPSAVVLGKQQPAAPTIPLPTDNSNIATDAASHGIVLLAGTTTLTLSVSGTQTNAQATTCTTVSASSCTTKTYLNVGATPVIYAPTSGSSCNANSYTPTGTTYPTVTGGSAYYGTCGDLYVSGTYNQPLTIAAQNNVIVTGSILNATDANGQTSPTGGATLGIVANAYVRVAHSCTGSTPNVTIDAAILALNDSFYADNYNCGSTGLLTIHGSIAQQYRGAVSTSSGNTVITGYTKSYNYDSRLKVIVPPYLFNLQNTSWTIVRETLCAGAQPSSSIQSCAYTGTLG